MAQAVEREIHKTHAFVRFRAIEGEAETVYVAWFEPAHHTLRAAAPFFVRRFANMRWSILTPHASAHWDGHTLQFGPGAHRAHAPDHDALEDLWRTYYASIFNPARLKTRTMRSHMPRRYWSNLPEAELIGELVAQAPRAAGAMIVNAPTQPRLRVPQHVASADASPEGLDALRAAAARCTACPLHAAATQTVFGDGAVGAPIMLVGEQPGDREDLAGEPFVGPAGQLLDRAMREAGIARDGVYITNAVKHFKFEPRGKRRLHKTPAQLEMEACRPWLEAEIGIVRPKLVVALGATAARSLLGRTIPVQRSRGKVMPVETMGTRLLVTVHPSYLLRVADDQQPEEYRRFVADLRLGLQYVSGGAT
jgi:DNA polymerase